MKGIFLKGKIRRLGVLCVFFFFSLFFFIQSKKKNWFLWMVFHPSVVLWNWIKYDMCSLFSAEYKQQIHMDSWRSCLTFPCHHVRSLRGRSAKHHVGTEMWIVFTSFWEVYKGFILTWYFLPCKMWRLWHLFWLI